MPEQLAQGPDFVFQLQIAAEACDDDLIEAMVRTMDTPDTFTGPVNIGNPGEFTMLELAQQVLKLTHSKSPLVFKPLPSDDPRQRQPNIGLANIALGGWTPQVQLAQGLKRTIDYFSKNLAPPT